MTKTFDLAIIGAGPAGMSAALYGSRGQLQTILFGDETKSNLYKSHVISNYLGFVNSPTGPELTELGLKHALQFGATHLKKEIVDLKVLEDKTFELKDSEQQLYHSKTVILATGQSYLLSGIQREQEMTGRGVSYCVICDGHFFMDKNIVVVGNGNYAAEEALQLLSYTKNISILSHGKEFAFNPHFQKEIENSGIKLIKTPRLKLIHGDPRVEKIEDSEGNFYPTEGIFLAIGVAGAAAFARMIGLEMNGSYIKVDLEGRTSIPGLYAAGDCTGAPAQVASSVGSGCNAALSCIKSIRGLNIYTQYN